MLYSEENRFLFIHVPKTGGTSIVEILKTMSDRVFLPLRAIGYFFDDRGYKLPTWTYPITGYPYHVSALKMRELWGSERMKTLFKFAFVRNPWDLTVSEYFYILSVNVHPKKKEVKGLDFHDFLKWKKKHYARPQSLWVCDEKGEVMLDFVGKFENYNNDVAKILNHLDVDSPIPHKNTTKKANYKSYYRNDEMINIVYEIYKQDIENFDYDF